jgi:alanyl-tRNA synthetase
MKRLYWTEPDVFETQVQVTSIGQNEVVTNPVIFHPDEGGQPEDKGYIGEAAVCKVRVVQGQIVHTLDRPLPDGRYTARIDRERRLATACQHTAQHILSGIAGRLDLATVAVHIGVESSTIDFDKRVDWDVARDLERQAMAVVARDVPVETAFDAEPDKVRSRLGPIESDVIRVVRIGDCDASACCGAHVRSTARIGMIRIFDLESHKGGTRVSFRAGDKALEQSQAETAILQELRKAAGCATADLPATLQKAMDRSKELAKEVERLWTLRLAELVKSAPVVTRGSSRIGIHVGEVPRELVSTLARMIAEAVDGAGVVLSETNIAIHSKTIDAGALLKQIQTHAGGKGGGSPRAANGRLDRPLTAEALTRLLTLPQDPYPA